jgi:hypothetical protein
MNQKGWKPKVNLEKNCQNKSKGSWLDAETGGEDIPIQCQIKVWGCSPLLEKELQGVRDEEKKNAISTKIKKYIPIIDKIDNNEFLEDFFLLSSIIRLPPL